MKRLRTRDVTQLVLVIGLLSVLARSSDADERLQKWAILADSASRKAGIADLLLAELTEAKFDLVERESIDKIARELELQALSMAGSVKQRAKTGKLLSANALVILSVKKSDPNRLQVIVCECQQGARLAKYEISGTRKNAPEAAEDIAVELIRLRRQYADGIRLLVAVPPFLSKNLAHTYDPYQGRWSDLLSNALAIRTGVAVVEIEEAREIGRENALTNGAAKNRRAVVAVNAEFRVEKKDADEIVQITAQLTTGPKVQTFEHKLRLSDVAKWLLEEFAPNILSTAEQSSKRLTTAQQRDVLVRRANLFATLGDWPRATGLRESLLLFVPSDAKQRDTLVNEY